MIKAVFFDIDGTLLDHSAHAVPESTIRAVEALREKGILTFTATGRHVTQMDTLPLGGMTFDGANSASRMEHTCSGAGMIGGHSAMGRFGFTSPSTRSNAFNPSAPISGVNISTR